MADDNRTELGKINVTKRALKIEDLEDKVKFAVESYKRAFDKYQRGSDSLSDWDMVIKALTIQMDEMRDYIAVAYHNIGIIYATKKNYDKSVEYLKEALKFNPNYPVAHHNLSLIYKKTGEFELSDRHADIAKKLGHGKDK